MSDRKALRRWDLSLRHLLPLVLGAAAACGGLDPIVGAPDAGTESAAPDGSLVDAPSSDVAGPDASSDADAEGATSPFSCGTKTCDAKTHYCEMKGVGDAGAKGDAGVEVDTCVALPLNCLDGGMPSCGCILEPCACNQTGDAITVTCP